MEAIERVILCSQASLWDGKFQPEYGLVRGRPDGHVGGCWRASQHQFEDGQAPRRPASSCQEKQYGGGRIQCECGCQYYSIARLSDA